jgi:hypothetical protein
MLLTLLSVWFSNHYSARTVLREIAQRVVAGALS